MESELQNNLKALAEQATKERALREEHYRVVELSEDPRQFSRDPHATCSCGACEKLFNAPHWSERAPFTKANS